MNTPGYFCMDRMIINQVVLQSIDTEDNDALKAWWSDGAIRFTGMEGYHATVYNASGATVTSFRIDNNEASVPFYTEKGMYIIRAEKDGKALTYKLTVR